MINKWLFVAVSDIPGLVVCSVFQGLTNFPVSLGLVATCKSNQILQLGRDIHRMKTDGKVETIRLINYNIFVVLPCQSYDLDMPV